MLRETGHKSSQKFTGPSLARLASWWHLLRYKFCAAFRCQAKLFFDGPVRGSGPLEHLAMICFNQDPLGGVKGWFVLAPDYGDRCEGCPRFEGLTQEAVMLNLERERWVAFERKVWADMPHRSCPLADVYDFDKRVLLTGLGIIAPLNRPALSTGWR